MLRTKTVAIFLELALLLAAGAALAQNVTGTISGRVTDKDTGAPMVGVTVVVEGAQGEAAATLTDEDGGYTLTNLTVGTYVVRFFQQNAKLEQQNVRVSVDKTVRVNVRMPSKASEETYVITEAAPAIDVGSTRTGATITEDFARNVPTGRSFGALIEKTPGVFIDRSGNASIAGGTGTENNYILDGVNVTSIEHGELGSNLVSDFVQETEVITGGYNAEYGRALGGVVNVVTKSGTNEFKGSAFAFWSPYFLSGTPHRVFRKGESLIGVRMPDYTTNVGAEVGGPIMKDRLFFWAGLSPTFAKSHMVRIVEALVDNDGDMQQDYDAASGRYASEEVARTRLDGSSQQYQYAGKLSFLANQNHGVSAAIYGSPGTSKGALTANAEARSAMQKAVENSTDLAIRGNHKLLEKKWQIDWSLGLHNESEDIGSDDPALNRRNSILWRTNNPNNNESLPNLYELEPSSALMAKCGRIQRHDPPTDPMDPKTAKLIYHYNPCPVNFYSTAGYAGTVASTLTARRLVGAIKGTNFFRAGGHHVVKYGADYEVNDFHNRRGFTGEDGGGHASIENYTNATIDPLTGKVIPGNHCFGAPSCNSAGGARARVHTFFSLPKGEHGYQRTDYNPDGGDWRDPMMAKKVFDPDGNGQLSDLLDAAHYKDYLDTRTETANTGFFLQDGYSILPNLTLNLGVRWEIQQLNDSQGQTFLTIDDNISPRVGLIFDPTAEGRSKIYASYARYYESIPMTINDRVFGGEGILFSYFRDADAGPKLKCGSADSQAKMAAERKSWDGSSGPGQGWRGCDARPSDSVFDPDGGVLGAGGHYWVVNGGANGLIQPKLKGQANDEIVLGGQYEVMQDLTLGLSYTRRWLKSVIEDASGDGGNTYIIGNPGQVDKGELDRLKGDAAAKEIVATSAADALATLEKMEKDMPGSVSPDVLTQARQANSKATDEYIQAQGFYDSAKGVSDFDEATRNYNAVTATATKRFSKNWLVQASYTYARVLGNYEGLYDPQLNYRAANITQQYDLQSFLYNREGPLSNDRPHIARLDGFYTMELGEAAGVTGGVGFRLVSGTPKNYLGNELIYQNNDAFILPRGSAGRTPTETSLDFHIGYRHKLPGTMRLEAFVDLFNVLNSKTIRVVDRNYTFDFINPIVNGDEEDLKYLKTVDTQVTPALNPNFGNAISYQAPFAGRLGLRLSF